ncbi:MAG: ATP-binding protein [Thermoanaerobaculia bacterium]
MPRRLATKLILALAVIALIVTTFSLYANLKSQERQLVESMVLGADQLSRSITSATWQSMLADHRQASYEVMKTIADKQGISLIRMFNKDGRLMFSTTPTEKIHVDESAEVCSPCHAAARPLVKVDVPSRARMFRRPDGTRAIAMITPIYNEPSCSQASCHAHPASVRVLGVLDLTLDASRIDEDMSAIRLRTGLLTAGEITLIVIFLLIFTHNVIDKPIRRLIAATKSISEMQLDQPIEIRSSEEFEHLARSFNLMRERLKLAMDQNAEFTQKLESKVEERTRQLKIAQQKLIQTDRLASLGELAASVAHEINNPLSGVLNLSMLMQRILKDDGIPPARIAEFRRYLEQVSTETSRVGRIVSDLLSFSRRSKPQNIEGDLNAVIRTTVSLVAHKLQLANVALDLQLDEKLPTLRCDPSQIQQVVINLLLNGAEALKGGGKVTVKTSHDEEHVLLEVSDTGAGIPSELLSKIFDPFFTTKEEGKGVGLGLAVVYGIVKAHNGEIEVTSHVGEGTSFHVSLPRTNDVAETTPSAPAAAKTGLEESRWV